MRQVRSLQERLIKRVFVGQKIFTPLSSGNLCSCDALENSRVWRDAAVCAFNSFNLFQIISFLYGINIFPASRVVQKSTNMTELASIFANVDTLLEIWSPWEKHATLSYGTLPSLISIRRRINSINNSKNDTEPLACLAVCKCRIQAPTLTRLFQSKAKQTP